MIFVNSAITDIKAYTALFDEVTTEKAIGEASPTYIHLPRAVARIYHYVPKNKVDCYFAASGGSGFSAYMHVVRDQRETAVDFAQCPLNSNKARIAQIGVPSGTTPACRLLL